MWTGFTRFALLSDKPPDGYTWSRRRLTRIQTTSRPDTLWPEMWKHMSDASKRKEKHKWAIEKPKLENARRLRGIYFMMRNSSFFEKCRKLEIPMPAATPFNLQRCPYRETCCAVGEHKTKYACIVEADESTRERLEGTLHKYLEDHVAGKGMNSMSHNSFVQIYSYASSNENTRCKGQQLGNNGQTRENTGMAADESQKQK